MRRPERIPEILNQLKSLWYSYPDLRLGQLILNVVKDPVLYYLEDEELIKILRDEYSKGEMSMKNKGKMQHRLIQNKLEAKFASEWEKINSIQRHGILDYLLAEDNNRPLDEVSDRDREVAATVIQWLGSPVGKNFLYQVIGETKNGKI